MTLTPLNHLFRRPSWSEAQVVATALRTETTGGAILLGAAALAFGWANSPFFSSYAALRDFAVGPHVGHLHLSLGAWAADGLLAVFFFVAGLELKREFLVGELTTPAKAALPVVAACCGVAVPALVYAGAVTLLGADSSALQGWAIPTATDIAFALAVLAVIGSHLPSALRSFLLTLAVVDDLIAITIIAIFYTGSLQVAPLLLAVVPLAAYGLLVQRRMTQWWLLVPLALATWALVHASGIHATVAGVLLGLTVPVRPRGSVPAMSTVDRTTDVAHRFEHRLRPLSAGFCVPVFAFFASGVAILGPGARSPVGTAVRDPLLVGIVAALVLGKVVGVFGGTWLTARFTRAETDDEVGWVDVAGVALLTGIGFTVSLLIGDLAFHGYPVREAHVKLAVLVGSLIAAVLAACVLVPRNAHYRRLEAVETEDRDGDGIPACFRANPKAG